ncbi:hypothetical protein Vi05172_g5575 [Venturia inaequalis]|nr:hypothetical protein Vi05172_g5575 [Venturia inaequalis]
MERPKKRVKLTIGNVAYLLDPAGFCHYYHHRSHKSRLTDTLSNMLLTLTSYSPNAAAASIKRASLLGIPTELRLEIFNYLLPNDLPFKIPDTKRLDSISKNWSVDRSHSKRAAQACQQSA